MFVRSVRIRLGVLATVVLAGCALVIAPQAGGADAPHALVSAGAVKVPVFTLPLTKVGEVNLTNLASSDARAHQDRDARAAKSGSYREVDNAILSRAPKEKPTSVPNPKTTSITTKNVKGEIGLQRDGRGAAGRHHRRNRPRTARPGPVRGRRLRDGVHQQRPRHLHRLRRSSWSPRSVRPRRSSSPPPTSSPTRAATTTPPPSAGSSRSSSSGAFNSPGSSSPRAPSSRRSATPPTRPAPTRSTRGTPATPPPPGCPCFGDYDNLGADDNGIYVATDEFGINSPAFNGTIIYAISKEQLETAAATPASCPPVFGYRLTQDPFGQPYVVAPATTPPGAKFATNTEYFVESNSNRSATTTSSSTPCTTPPSSAPRRARRCTARRSPPRATRSRRTPPRSRDPARSATPYQDPAGGIQADFNAEMEPDLRRRAASTRELDTGTTSGSDAVDWFILQPDLSGTTPLRLGAPPGSRRGLRHEPAVPLHRRGLRRRRLPALLAERPPQLSRAPPTSPTTPTARPGR